MQHSRDPLRVVITSRAVAPWHGRGGLERHVADLVRHLALRGLHVTLVAPPPAPGIAPVVESNADGAPVRILTVPYVTFPGAGRPGTTILDRDTAYPFFGWRAGRVAARLARAGEIDVVHGLGASVLGYAMARRHEPLPPLVLNPQGLEEFGATDPARARLKVAAYWPLQRAVLRAAAAADRIIATDRSLASVVMTHLHVPASRVTVLPNAVDLDRCASLATPETGQRVRLTRSLDAAVPVLLSVGRLEANKGLHVLADALGRLAAAGHAFHWVVVGEGPYRSRVARAIEEAGIAALVLWAGRVSDADLHAWYEAADLFVHPTLYEGSSLVTLEAMAHRLPVVATRAGGLPDKVEPGITGWLCPPGDAAALTDVLVTALAARSRWTEMGAAGRLLAERTFAWPTVAAQHQALYEELLT